MNQNINYSNLDPSYLRNLIINTYDKKDKQNLLEKEEVKKVFLKEENHYEFIWLIQALKKEEICYFIDDYVLEEILKSEKASDKINAIMTLDNDYKNIALNKVKVVKYVYNNYLLSYYLDGMNTPFLETMFNLIIEEKKSFNLLNEFNKESLHKILIKNNNLKRLTAYKDYLNIVPIDLLNEVISQEPHFSKILNSDINTIKNLIEKGLILPINIYTNPKFVDKYLIINNGDMFTKCINGLDKNNIYASKIIQKNMFDKWDKEFQIELSEYTDKKELLTKLISKYFLDLTPNVLINIESIVEFNKYVNVIPSERIKNYNKILSFETLKIEEIKELYSSLTLKYREYLYDDFRLLQNISYNMLNNKFINLDNMNYKEINNVKIYELKGETFFMPVHATSIENYMDVDNQAPWRKSTDNDTISLSIISDKFLGTYRSPSDCVVFGFNKLDEKNIMHMYHSDSFTSHRYQTNVKNEILTPEKLIDNTKGYNEILVMEDEKIKPEYIVCYDNVKENDLKASKKMNIPIVIIHTEYYKEAINNFSVVDFINDDDTIKYTKL